MKRNYPKVVSRGETFAERIATRIWKEIPTPDNPYLAERCLCHGYNWLALVQERGFIEVLYLLLQGDLPSPPQARLFEATLVALCNPGPRHPATRAVMNAAVSKADPAHLLPIGMAILGGAHLGARQVQDAMRFLRRNLRRDPESLVRRLIEEFPPAAEGDRHVAPGFGQRFGGLDPLPQQIVQRLAAMEGAGQALGWGQAFCQCLAPYGHGWLSPGVAAAAFLDLGFHPRAGAGLFQLASAPGLLAHGLEMSNRPVTAMPFVPQERYFMEDPADEPCR